MDAPNEPPEPAGEQPPAAAPQPAVDPSARIDEMGEASFPASDPPAVWTWEPRRPG